MPIKLSGPLSGTEIATEFVDTVPYSLSEFYRGGAKVPNSIYNALIPTSGTIKYSDFYGASKIVDFVFTVAAHQANTDVRTLAFSYGWDGTARIKMTIASGIYISATSTALPALRIIGPFPSGVEITNYGVIVGMGGAGGAGSGVTIGGVGGVVPTAGSAGGAGGPALQASAPVTIANYGIIGGGGGGGGGGRTRYQVTTDDKGSYYQVQRGGGGGGGRATLSANSAGGAAGFASPQSSWQFLYSGPYFVYAGSIGTVNGGGAGGRGDGINGSFDGGVGGGGGGWGSGGGAGSTGVGFAGSSSAGGPYAGGPGGAAVLGNANITWVAVGTRLGAVS